MMSTPKPFNVAVPDSALSDLQQRLALTRFPDELDAAGWDYGTPLADVKRLVARWKDGYDWRQAEKTINELPMFTLPISVVGFGELGIHFVHKRSKLANAIPLLFVHGWPGSFLEVVKILEPLTSPNDPRYPAFHVVAPSLPNFGFSDAPKGRGFKQGQYAEVCDKLMRSLGYDQYVTQGGDWGSRITRTMAEKYGGQSLKAYHTNFPRGRKPSLWKQPLLYFTPYTAEERAQLLHTRQREIFGMGYVEIQGTKPQTLGYNLADSPVGLLAWIYEKLVTWSDSYPWTDDEVLTFVSIYWFSKAGPAASVRIYYEVIQGGERYTLPDLHHVPMGVSHFPLDYEHPPSSHIRAAARVVYEVTHKNGGHFAAHETPELLVQDLREMFGRGGPAFGVVKGATGYAPRAKL